MSANLKIRSVPEFGRKLIRDNVSETDAQLKTETYAERNPVPMNIMSSPSVSLVGFSKSPDDYEKEYKKHSFIVYDMDCLPFDWDPYEVQNKVYKKAFRWKYQHLISKKSDAPILFREECVGRNKFLKLLRSFMQKRVVRGDLTIGLRCHTHIMYFPRTSVISSHMLDRGILAGTEISAVRAIWFSHDARVIVTCFADSDH